MTRAMVINLNFFLYIFLYHNFLIALNERALFSGSRVCSNSIPELARKITGKVINPFCFTLSLNRFKSCKAALHMNLWFSLNNICWGFIYTWLIKVVTVKAPRQIIDVGVVRCQVTNSYYTDLNKYAVNHDGSFLAWYWPSYSNNSNTCVNTIFGHVFERNYKLNKIL